MTDKPDPTGFTQITQGLQNAQTGSHLESISSSLDSISFPTNKEKNNIERITTITQDAGLTPFEQEIQKEYRNLPSHKEEFANIKYLGSSYSGVDIKVIAHMYDQVDLKEDKIAKLESDLAVAKEVATACLNISLNSNSFLQAAEGVPEDYNTRRDVFLQIAGLNLYPTPDKEQARQVMISQVFTNGNFSFLGIAQMKRRADAIRNSYEDLSIELEDQLKNIRELDKVESSSTIALGTLQTLSVQSFREKNAVRALGHSYAKSYTRGSRTIGGSMIFTIFNEHALAGLIRGMSDSTTYGERDTELATLLPDQLPPIDLTIVFANEYGSLSDFRLYGVEFFTDGSVFSIEDLLSEQTMNFVCRDADIMTSRGRIRLSRLQRGMHNGKDDKDRTGTSLLFDNQDYYNYLDKLGVRRRLLNR